MDIMYYYGPEKSRITIEEGYPQTMDGRIPFHGIIPQGFLQAAESSKQSSDLWHTNAFRLSTLTSDIESEDFSRFTDFINKCRVLSWVQSAKVVQVYLEKFLRYMSDSLVEVEAWNMKEGHTSSVWRIKAVDDSTTSIFALNVARDHESGLELKKTMGQLKIIQKSYPELPIAGVQDISLINHPKLPGEIVITRNEWIHNAFEIHQRLNQEAKRKEYLLVERFLTDPDRPAHITSVLGRMFNKSESLRIQNFYKKFNKVAADVLPDSVRLNINDGDLVWCNDQAMVVALS